MQQQFYSNGKLLLTGEYAVLDGGLSLAVPTKYGQYLNVDPKTSDDINWKSINSDGSLWFEASFDSKSLKAIQTTDENVAATLSNILRKAQKLNPGFLENTEGYDVTTTLTFDRNWGLGSSSTLINNIADWASVDPYRLLRYTFGGSGYDLACAKYDHPISYQLIQGRPIVKKVDFNPEFKTFLYFVYLNKKQNSREAIANYKNQNVEKSVLLKKISDITEGIVRTKSYADFQELLQIHEEVLSSALKIKTVQSQLFSDFDGVIKSLGGWGGDFVLASGNEKTPDYFKSRGFKTIIPYQEMVL
ncbi:GYDIA family GHMP kinase [Croceitalea sp. MTPC5]|uniref:GYDIA family GHMP kinase n=1 Tax=Croceitalea sp. MTPC5 TaxID=3056565 RepID=UPI002B372631|nr:GYDIA family GHMP kinase [Croceitalea sp. MTPC5]